MGPGAEWGENEWKWVFIMFYVCGTGLDIYKITPLNTYRINFFKKLTDQSLFLLITKEVNTLIKNKLNDTDI